MTDLLVTCKRGGSYIHLKDDHGSPNPHCEDWRPVPTPAEPVAGELDPEFPCGLHLGPRPVPVVAPEGEAKKCESKYHRPTSIYCLDCIPADAPLAVLLLSNRKPTAEDIRRGREIAKTLENRPPTNPRPEARVTADTEATPAERDVIYKLFFAARKPHPNWGAFPTMKGILREYIAAHALAEKE